MDSGSLAWEVNVGTCVGYDASPDKHRVVEKYVRIDGVEMIKLDNGVERPLSTVHWLPDEIEPNPDGRKADVYCEKLHNLPYIQFNKLRFDVIKSSDS